MVGDKISFSIVTDRKEKIMNVFLRFKIQYYTMIQLGIDMSKNLDLPFMMILMERIRHIIV